MLSSFLESPATFLSSETASELFSTSHFWYVYIGSFAPRLSRARSLTNWTEGNDVRQFVAFSNVSSLISYLVGIYPSEHSLDNSRDQLGLPRNCNVATAARETQCGQKSCPRVARGVTHRGVWNWAVNCGQLCTARRIRDYVKFNR